MAMDVGGGKGGVISTINVTPLVDVMLVLLIIMMIVAPMLQQGIVLNLPEATYSSDKPDTADQTVVYIDAKNKLYVNQIECTQEQAVDKLKSALEGKTERVVYLKGDKDSKYGAIMNMMDALRKAGIESVGLITERKGAGLFGGGQ